MAWNLSTGMIKALLGKTPSVKTSAIGTTISFGDGDGTGSTDTINGTGTEFTNFEKHDWVLVIGGTNNNVMVKAVTAAAAKLEVPAGSFTAEAAGTAICIVALETGSVQEILKNGVLVGYSTGRPAAGADAAEAGTKLVTITKGGLAFVAEEATNGLNLGEFSDTTLKRAIDPETGITEEWKGLPTVAGTVAYYRWYANDMTTGASTSAVRMDGVAATSGGDVTVNTTSLLTSVYNTVSDVELDMSAV